MRKLLLIIIVLLLAAGAVQALRLSNAYNKVAELENDKFVLEKQVDGFQQAKEVRQPDVVDNSDNDTIIESRVEVKYIDRVVERTVTEVEYVDRPVEIPEGVELVGCELREGDLFGFCEFEVVKSPEGDVLGRTTWQGSVKPPWGPAITRRSDPEDSIIQLEVRKDLFEPPGRWATELRAGYGTRGVEVGFTRYGKGRLGYWGQGSYDPSVLTVIGDGYTWSENRYSISGGVALRLGRK